LIAPARPELGPKAIHVWTLAVRSLHTKLPEPRDLLSSEELERWQRFRFDVDRQRFAVGREGLRILLAGYTEADPTSLCFAPSDMGKPQLSHPATDLRFNLSHSHEYIMVAVTRHREIGVDLEFQREAIEIDQLADRFFSSSERNYLKQVVPRDRSKRFFQLWTAKEALVKAMGSGLAIPLSSFDVDLHPISGARLIATRPDAGQAARWNLQTIPAPEGYVAALGVEGGPEVPELLSWQ
jgi:4'-phosphopantetheinyl transferase